MTGLCWVLFGYALICLITNVYSQADPFDDTDDKDTESSGSGTLSVIILFVVIAKFIFCCGCWRLSYGRYRQQRRIVTLTVAQTEQTDMRQNTASPRAICDDEMQPRNAYSNAMVVDVGDVTPHLPFDTPPPYRSPTFEQSKTVNQKPANVAEMQTGSFTSNPRHWVSFKEEDASVLPAIAGAQPEGSEKPRKY